MTFEEWIVRWHQRTLTDAAIRELRLILEREEEEDA